MENRIPTAIASGVIPSCAGLLGSFLINRIVSNSGIMIGITTAGILSGKFIKYSLKREQFETIKSIIKAFLERDLENDIIKIKINIVTMKNQHEFLKSKEDTLSLLQSTVIQKIEYLQQIGRIDITTE